MKFLNGSILCLEGCEFIQHKDNPDGLVPKGTYDSLKSKSKIVVHGRGGNGSQVLIEFETMPDMYKELVRSRFGDPYEYMAKEPIRELIRPDAKAIEYFERYRLPDGRSLKDEHRIQYANDAAILNAFTTLLSDKKKLKSVYKITVEQFWQTACEIIRDLNSSNRFPNSLPTSDRRLKPRYKEYKGGNYESLISDKYCNDNRRKVDEELERLILSLYIQQNKPFAKEVHEIYQRFMTGEIEVVDVHSGELFSREKFYKDGEPILISETTVWSYINKPVNRITVDKIRTSGLEFNTTYRPHIHRHAPVYAFSKITMDDISIPFKMADGTRVWSYQIFDVASGCVIGKSFGKDKNRGLFTKSVQDMFRLVHANGWGIPAEIEIEQHISNTFADDLLKEGAVFPFVRFCRGGNPQEKRAERFIGGKKFGLQAKREGFQRRPFARLEARRMNEDQDKVRYAYNDIVANEIADINTWNNQPHHDQVKYPGMTRWQVLCSNQNPELINADPALLSKFIGNHTETSIDRSQYVRVKGQKYHLPDVSCLNRLESNNLDVDAYYIADINSNINEVHLYQNDEYICTCHKLETFNEARAEQTSADIKTRDKQFGFRTEFDSMVKDRVASLSKVKVHENKPVQTASEMPDEVREETVDNLPDAPINTDLNDESDAQYWSDKALDDL